MTSEQEKVLEDKIVEITKSIYNQAFKNGYNTACAVFDSMIPADTDDPVLLKIKNLCFVAIGGKKNGSNTN